MMYNEEYINVHRKYVCRLDGPLDGAEAGQRQRRRLGRLRADLRRPSHDQGAHASARPVVPVAVTSKGRGTSRCSTNLFMTLDKVRPGILCRTFCCGSFMKLPARLEPMHNQEHGCVGRKVLVPRQTMRSRCPQKSTTC